MQVEQISNNRCRRCGRSLENVTSVQNGVGPVCLHKILGSSPNGDLNRFMPKVLDEEIAQLFRNQMTIHQCKHCQTDLDSAKMLYYEHSDGWEIPGFVEKQWLMIECPKCHVQWSLWKLGVDR